jgi:hypothetical protein
MMSKMTKEEIQQALGILLAEGLVEIIGIRDGRPVYRATAKGMSMTVKSSVKLQ